ncbi:MAG: mechanosensitive ion channel [ANME-2 cluster archaeon]|jgi:small conductance mechanosensitive channel|nr:MAG: mechanosensitive ion channel [ANME-2 cluster archaeon]
MQDITPYLTDVFQAVEPYLKVILVIVVAFFVISLIKRLVRRLLDVTSLPLDVQNILRRIVVYVLWISVLMYVSIALRLEEIFMPLIGASVLVGAAVALAVKDALSDAVAGIFLLLDRHFNIGDEIETMSRRGEIIDVTLRKTRLKTGDGTIVVLPNGKIDSSGWILHNEKTEAEKK